MQESLDNLSNDIKNLIAARKTTDESAALIARLEQAREIAESIEETTTQWNFLRHAAVVKKTHQITISKSVRPTIEAIKNARSLFADPATPLQHPEIGELDSPIEDFIEKIKTQILQAWYEYQGQVRDRIKFAPNALMAFSEIEKFQSSVSDIMGLVKIVDSLLASPPETETEISQLETALDELVRRITAFFSADQMPPSVLEFVRAAASDGAEIDKLSVEVQKWIKENGLESNFSIKLTGRRD